MAKTKITYCERCRHSESDRTYKGISCCKYCETEFILDEPATKRDIEELKQEIERIIESKYGKA